MQRNTEKNIDDVNGVSEIKLIAESIKNLYTQAFLIYKPISHEQKQRINAE